MNAVALVFGGVVGAAITFSTVFVLMRILAWMVTEGIPSMISRRSEAVVEWQDCDRKDETEEWPDSDRWRRHVDQAVAAVESPLLREIYAAQALYRDGHDIERGAPKERVS